MRKFTSNVFTAVLFLFMATIVSSCKSGNSEDSQAFLSTVKGLEKTLSDSISTDPNVVKVIAYHTYRAQTQAETSQIKELAKTTVNTGKRQYFFATDGSFYRVYFPITDAIIKYDQRNIPTDINGALVSANPVHDLSIVELAGKYGKQTEEAKEAKQERPIQMLREAIPAEKKVGSSIHTDSKIVVFNLGERKLGDKIVW